MVIGISDNGLSIQVLQVKLRKTSIIILYSYQKILSVSLRP